MFTAMNRFVKLVDTIERKLCKNHAGKIKKLFQKIIINKFFNKIRFPHRCGFMYGELTDKETVARLEYSLENQQQDQFEVLLYKKNSKWL